MNGNTAKKIEVQAENTARKMSNMRSEKWHKQDTTWALSLFELQLEQGCSFTD